MPEPYPFPEVPKGKFSVQYANPKMPALTLAFNGESPVLLLPPTEETNNVGFFARDGRVLVRFAFIVDDQGEFAVIGEDGMKTNVKDLSSLAFKIALGSERYDKYKEIIEK